MSFPCLRCVYICVLGVAASLPTLARAAPVISITSGVSTSGLTLFDIDVNPNGTTYNAIDVTISANNGTVFNQTGGHSFVTPSSDDTGFLLDMTFGGFQSFGPSEDNSTLQGTWASLGSDTISAATQNFAQIVISGPALPSGHTVPVFSYSFAFANEGAQVAAVTGVTPTAVPEPSSFLFLAYAAMAMVTCVIGARSRHWATVAIPIRHRMHDEC